MNLGMTGSRNGISDAALCAFKEFLSCHKSKFAMAHHGDCLGADKQFHDIIRSLDIMVTVHPPDNPKMRAYSKGDIVQVPYPYLKRNHNIVNACSVLVAFPGGRAETLRSGTWSTIRYARKEGKTIHIFYPDGTHDREN